MTSRAGPASAGGGVRRHDAPTRRELLHCLAVLALGSAGCRQLLPNARHARYFLMDPHPDDYLPTLSALLETVLPFDDPAFPGVPPTRIHDRFLRMFRLEAERRFLVLQQALLFFDDVELFPEAIPAILAEERRVLRGQTGLDLLLAGSVRRDRKLFAGFRSTAGPGPLRFTDLSLGRRREYFYLWSGSGFSVKRRFARSTRDLAMIAAYSLPEVWAAIGYEGPLLERS